MNSIKETTNTKELLVKMSELERKVQKLEKKARPVPTPAKVWGRLTPQFFLTT